jgi:hypothetical protein
MNDPHERIARLQRQVDLLIVEQTYEESVRSQLTRELADARTEIGELKKDKARLEWLLPRQYNHQTRESVDKEL